MSDGNLLTVPSKSKPPVSILKTKPTNAARLAYKIIQFNVSPTVLKKNIANFFANSFNIDEERLIESL